LAGNPWHVIMHHTHQELSEQIYRRIYRLHHQKADARIIAAALNLPLNTVHNVIDRIRGEKHAPKSPVHDAGRSTSKARHLNEIVAFTFSKVRYAVVDVSGPITGKNCEHLERELNNLLSSEFRAMAILLTEASALDEAGAKVIRDFHTAFAGKGRYAALLDPSPDIEPAIATLHLDDEIPIFGTERAFEESAFAVDVENKSKKASRVGPVR
jgi:anti-anti-sigma regulatory factor